MPFAMTDFEQIFNVLNDSKVRFVVVGGVAVVLHGYTRFTADVDLVVALDGANAARTIAALQQLDFRPRAPVPAEAFADEATRKEWIEDKGMTVFSLWSPRFPLTVVDLFVSEPFPFEDLYARATVVQLGEQAIAIASLQDLITMKEAAGRPNDLTDVEKLKVLLLQQRGGPNE